MFASLCCSSVKAARSAALDCVCAASSWGTAQFRPKGRPSDSQMGAVMLLARRNFTKGTAAAVMEGASICGVRGGGGGGAGGYPRPGKDRCCGTPKEKRQKRQGVGPNDLLKGGRTK